MVKQQKVTGELLQHTPTTADDANEFSDATHLFYKKEDVAQHNHKAITNLGPPITQINAINSCAAAASAKSDDTGGLEAVIFMAEGSQVILTSNLWQQVGLCNGTNGTV